MRDGARVHNSCLKLMLLQAAKRREGLSQTAAVAKAAEPVPAEAVKAPSNGKAKAAGQNGKAWTLQPGTSC